MKKQERNPFLPFVTVDDIVKFDPTDTATYTESKFINAVLRAIDRVGAANTRRIASYLAMDERLLNSGVHIACGMTLTDLRRVVTIKTVAAMRAQNPKTSLDDVAFTLGFADRSSVWAILNSKKFAELVQRLCPDMLPQRRERLTSEEWDRILAEENRKNYEQ